MYLHNTTDMNLKGIYKVLSISHSGYSFSYAVQKVCNLHTVHINTTFYAIIYHIFSLTILKLHIKKKIASLYAFSREQFYNQIFSKRAGNNK